VERKYDINRPLINKRYNKIMEELYNMKLHDVLQLNRWLTVVKVPNGWMYVFEHPQGGVTSQFVTSRKGKND